MFPIIRQFLLNAYNCIDYPIRQSIALQRGIPKLPYESKEGLFSHLTPGDKEKAENRFHELNSLYTPERLENHGSVDL